MSRQFFDQLNETKLVDETPRIKRRNERILTQQIFQQKDKIVLHPLNFGGKYARSESSDLSESSSEKQSQSDKEDNFKLTRKDTDNHKNTLNGTMLSGLHNISLLIPRGPDMETRTSALVDGYKIIKVIGKGSFSSVYKARDSLTNQEVVRNEASCFYYFSGHQDY